MAANPLALARQLTHHQRVTRLYRNSLKHLLSWTMNRDAWREQAVLLREKFDENKSLTDRHKIENVLKYGEAEFEKWRHPAPYIRKFSLYTISKTKIFLNYNENFIKIKGILTIYLFSFVFVVLNAAVKSGVLCLLINSSPS